MKTKASSLSEERIAKVAPSVQRKAYERQSNCPLISESKSKRSSCGTAGGGYERERHRIISRPLQLAARKHAGRVVVNQNA